MNLKSLSQQIKIKESFLCVGLDIDLSKIPTHILNEKDPIFVFSKSIIDATHKYAVAYKPNLAFFEAYGIKGWKAFEKTIDYMRMMKIVKSFGYTGYIGVEYEGNRLSEEEGIKATRDLLIKIGQTI